MTLQRPDEDRTFAFNVSKKEALYISDSSTRMVSPRQMHHEGVSLRSAVQSATIHVTPRFIAKIGRAIAFLTYSEMIVDEKSGKRRRKEINAKKKYMLTLTEFEMWQMWELAQSYLHIGKVPVGYDLKVRLAQKLYGEDGISERLLSTVEGIQENE